MAGTDRCVCWDDQCNWEKTCWRCHHRSPRSPACWSCKGFCWAGIPYLMWETNGNECTGLRRDGKCRQEEWKNLWNVSWWVSPSDRKTLVTTHFILVMRYSPYSEEITKIVRSGALGELINIVQVEPVGYYHFAHSYVRGNWNKEKQSSFSLMTKCCQ